MNLKKDIMAAGASGSADKITLSGTQWLLHTIGNVRKRMAIAVGLSILLVSLQAHGQAISHKMSATGPLVSGKISPASQTIGYNTFPASLSSTLPTGGNGSYSYQWQSSTNGNTWMNEPGAQALTYVPPALRVTTYYRLVSMSNGGRVTSGTATVNVKNKE
jgi:hypothetical protein